MYIPLTPDLGHSRMGRNEASRQNMRRGLRHNWALVLHLVLAGDFGQVTSPPYVSDSLTYYKGVPPVTSQCAFEESLHKKVDVKSCLKGMSALQGVACTHAMTPHF